MKNVERILIHACCAHCLGQLLAGLKAEATAYAPVVFWYNPNIHPLIEWRRRLKAVKMLVERARLPLIADETYGLVEFCRAVHGHEGAPERCARCYALRLGAAFSGLFPETAAKLGRRMGSGVIAERLSTSDAHRAKR